MKKKELFEKIEQLAAPLCAQAGVFLWDVSFEKEGRNHVLTLFIDRAQGSVFIEDCEKVSRGIDPFLDAPEFDSLPPYTLSVSSPGLQRKLTKPAHFDWALGKQVEITFYKAGQWGNRLVGRLLSADASGIEIETPGGIAALPRELVASARMHFEF